MRHRIRWIITLGVLCCFLFPSAAVATTGSYLYNPLYPTNKNLAALALGVNTIDGYAVDSSFVDTRQCVEYVKRFYYYAMGYRSTNGGLIDSHSWGGNGSQYYGTAADKHLKAYANGGKTKPQVGDILCFGGGSGHVAIVIEVGSSYVKVIEQRYLDKASIRSIALTAASGTYTVANSASGQPCQGWLRAKYAAPTSLSVASASYVSLKVSWKAVYGVSGYTVYRATSENGTYTAIKNTTSTSFTDTGRVTGTTYYYKVRAYRMVGSTRVYGSYSGIKSGKAMLATVRNVRTVYATGAIGVRWDQVTGANGYEVWRSTSSGGTYTRVKTVSGQASLAFNNYGVAVGKTYYYKVRAYRTIGSSNVYGPFSSVASGHLF